MQGYLALFLIGLAVALATGRAAMYAKQGVEVLRQILDELRS